MRSVIEKDKFNRAHFLLYRKKFLQYPSIFIVRIDKRQEKLLYLSYKNT